jgi:hypothetical protein
VEQRIVGQLPIRAHPQPLAGLPTWRRQPWEVADVTLIDRTWPVHHEPIRQLVEIGIEALANCRQVVCSGHPRHLRLVGRARALIDVERALEVEDGPAVLDRNHAPCRERTAVADAVDLVEDRCCWISRAQEVRMEGMDATRVNRPTRRDQRLCGHLASEDTQTSLVEILAAEDVHLDGFEVKQFDELAQSLSHR